MPDRVEKILHFFPRPPTNKNRFDVLKSLTTLLRATFIVRRKIKANPNYIFFNCSTTSPSDQDYINDRIGINPVLRKVH